MKGNLNESHWSENCELFFQIWTYITLQRFQQKNKNVACHSNHLAAAAMVLL